MVVLSPSFCTDPLLDRFGMLECMLRIDGYVILDLGLMDTNVMFCVDGVERSRHNRAVIVCGGYAISHSSIQEELPTVDSL